jgi:hypothetical protein
VFTEFNDFKSLIDFEVYQSAIKNLVLEMEKFYFLPEESSSVPEK